MTNKTATIYDVAEKAGISIATVSRVINTPDKVSPKTRDNVYNVMEILGFTPKAEARERARKHVGRIGVITPYFTYPSFIHRLWGISEALKGTAFELVIINLELKDDIENYLRSPGLKDRIDGFIILSQKLSDSTLKIIEDMSLKVVFVEFGEDNYSSVCIDNFRGGEIVAEYLLGKGYKSFAILTENENEIKVHPNQMRVNGFLNVMRKQGMTLTEKSIQYTGNELTEAMKSAENLLKVNNPEVIFATTDLLAVSVIKTAKKQNINIPEDLGLIGFDGTDTSEYLDMTTVDQSLGESGKLAVDLLLKQINNSERPVQTIYLPLKIIERNTTTS
jgi:LacI family transcriptional regulator, galactose operon repressor